MAKSDRDKMKALSASLASFRPSAPGTKVTKAQARRNKLEKFTASQKKAQLILGTGLASAVAGLAASESKRSAITAQGKFGEAQTLLQAKALERQAEDAERRGEEDVSILRRQTRSLIGAQRAAIGASGVDVGTGTAAALQIEAKLLGDLDVLTARNNAFRESVGFQRQALQAESQARLDRISRKAQASSQRIKGIQSAASAALGAFGSFQKAGGFLKAPGGTA